jgi:hypothetical protein
MSHRGRGAAVLLLLLVAPLASAAERKGGLVGLVEDSEGFPVPGAVISLFGRGIGSSGLVTLSDSAGRFFLPSLPAGSYTVRALGADQRAAQARQVTVVPGRDALFTVSLTPPPAPETREAVAAPPAAPVPVTVATEQARELRWLLRHKRRSVLESRGDEVPVESVQDDGWDNRTPQLASLDTLDARLLSAAPTWLSNVAGTVEVMAAPTRPGAEVPARDMLSSGAGSLQLNGTLGGGRWSVGGVVAESEGTTWRMAADFLIEPTPGHRIQAGSGYGTLSVRPVLRGQVDRLERGVGAVFIQDEWQVSQRVTATLGTRFSYVGFLEDRNHVDPAVSLQLRTDERTRVRGTVSARTVAPGGDLLTLSALSSAPSMAFAVFDDDVRAERALRYELALEQNLAGMTLSAHTYYEGVRDQLVNAFEGADGPRSLRIFNGGGVGARGMGVRLGRSFGGALSGSLSYTYGHTWREDAPAAGSEVLAYREADFHDVVARLETVIDWSGTRLAAFYRFNRLDPGVEEETAPRQNSRFDVQLSQGLPFIGGLTRADWEVLVAVRNMFYEPGEGALVDEMVVLRPPTRVLGGISIRF